MLWKAAIRKEEIDLNRKIKRYPEEIERTEKKIEELQTYLKGVRVALKAEEDYAEVDEDEE